jgi:hypothetical protein
MMRQWVESAPDKDRGRLGEIASRVALISASANGDKAIASQGIAAAIAFAEWQESVRARYKAGVALTLDAQLTTDVLNYFEHPKLIGKFQNLRVAIRRMKWELKYGDKIMRVVRALVQSGSLEAEYEEDDDGKPAKKKPTGFFRAPDEARAEA